MSDSDKTLVTNRAKEPICPHCGHVNTTFEEEFRDIEGGTLIWCCECEKGYICIRTVTYRYTTKRVGHTMTQKEHRASLRTLHDQQLYLAVHTIASHETSYTIDGIRYHIIELAREVMRRLYIYKSEKGHHDAK